MQITYKPKDDVLITHFSDAHSVKAVSQGWSINIGYTAAGDIAEIEVLDAQKIGLYPVEVQEAL